MGFEEIADRVWVSRRAWCDVNVTVVRGERGLVVVDTHGSLASGRALVDDVRALGRGEVVAVVTTHDHYDHAFGTGAFLEAWGPLPVHAHETAAALLTEAARRGTGEYRGEHAEEVHATEVVVPDHVFSSAAVLDLGDRVLELVHPGRGHTAGDLVVRVPDADVLLAGDLVEEAPPAGAGDGAVPAYGADSFPLEWPWSLDVVLSLTTARSVVVPGHGSPVDRDFVEVQRNEIGLVATEIRDLVARGVPEAEALATGSWPYPAATLADAVARGYSQLPRTPRRLPLV